MSTSEKEIILYTDDKAAKPHTMQGWVSSDGFFYKEEAMARYRGCTHKICECGKPMEKLYTKCSECRHKSAVERYQSLPFKEWDGVESVCTSGGDRYFFSEEELIDWMNDEGITEIDLLFCEGNNYQEIDSSYWSDVMHDDQDELPKKMQEAIDALNKVISELPPASYSPGKIRTSYKYEPDQED